MDAAPGKRKKDPQIAQLRLALEQFQNIAESYREWLEAELAAARAEAEPYDHLIRALERQIGSLRSLEAILDDRLWPDLIALANGSAYVQHARTREYF